MKAMILAAGFGTRLRPLTNKVPKPMVPILNRPILEHTIHLLRTHGIQDITVNLHHLPEMIQEYFGDGKDFEVQQAAYEADIRSSETSWCQHFFKYETPKAVAKMNEQQEFNVHNIHLSTCFA